MAQFLNAVENYYRRREAQGAAFEKPKSKEEADRLEGRNADLKRQRDDATDDVIKNLNKNLSDLERTTSTLSGKTLTQAHGLSSDQILEQTLPTIKQAYDELEQKSVAILKEEIARRQALGEQTADLDKKLADKQAEIGSKRQAALTTGLEAYERQAKQSPLSMSRTNRPNSTGCAMLERRSTKIVSTLRSVRSTRPRPPRQSASWRSRSRRMRCLPPNPLRFRNG